MPSPRAAAARTSRRLGQNFLVDTRAARAIVEALDPQRDSAVLEIGPGRGALTSLLVERVEHVVAIEVDPRLAAHLRRRFDPRRLEIIEHDVLSLDWDTVAARLGVDAGRPLAVVGNLPYVISKPLALRLVRERARVERAVLTFQREVVERLVAPPGGRTYGAMTVLVGLAFRVERLFDLAPGAFRPRPRVVSTVTHWARAAPELLPVDLEAPLRACLAAGFGHRRRTLFNNLRAALPGGERAARDLLGATGIDGGLRAEAVPPEDWVRLAAHWPLPGR